MSGPHDCVFLINKRNRQQRVLLDLGPRPYYYAPIMKD
jgi:hypothetical protein